MMGKALKTAAFGLLASVAAITPALASDLTYFTTVTDTDVATFGIGNLRGNGTGTLNVAGLSGSISSAFLYWHGPTNSSLATANASVTFNGTDIRGTNIGVSQDNFWGMLNSQAYRADVTSLITGNGAYSLANFNKPDAEINGASLIVFFNDGNLTNNSDVVLFNGNDANFDNPYDALGWNATLNGVNYVSGDASMTLSVSDGQSFTDGTLSFNGTPIDGGQMFDGTNSQIGNGTAPGNGSLWDVKTYDITSLISTGNNSLSMTNNSDALSLITVMFSLPVGAAPPLPSVPEPATWAMFIGGFGMVGGAMRRRKTAVSFA